MNYLTYTTKKEIKDNTLIAIIYRGKRVYTGKFFSLDIQYFNDICWKEELPSGYEENELFEYLKNCITVENWDPEIEGYRIKDLIIYGLIL